MDEKKTVVIEVEGGVANPIFVPEGITLIVNDLDTEKVGEGEGVTTYEGPINESMSFEDILKEIEEK